MAKSINRSGGWLIMTTQLQRPKGYWNSWQNMKREILATISKEQKKRKKNREEFDPSVWPSKKVFQPTLYKHLSLHGGAREIALRLGLNYSRKEKDFWTNFENVKAELVKAQKELEIFPDYMPYKSEVHCTLRYGIEIHGGFIKVRERLNLKEQELEGKWDDIEKLFKEIRIDINEIGGDPNVMPRAKALRPYIAKAIQQHGTLREIAEQMGLIFDGCSTNYWTKERAKEQVLQCQNHFKIDSNISPTPDQLISYGAMTAVQVAFGNCTKMQEQLHLLGTWKVSPKRLKEIDEEIEKRGYVRKGKWVNFDHPTDYFCLKHKQTKATQPGNLLVGQFMYCCGRDNAGTKRTSKAASEYDAKLKDNNKYLLRIDDYIDSTTPIRHKCIIHGETLPARPSNCLTGYGLSCCASRGFDSVKNALNDTHNFKFTRPTAFYIYQLEFFPEFYKLGIDANGLRDKDLEYGEEKLYKEFESRKQAFFLEQALLHKTLLIQKERRIKISCPYELKEAKWPGATEVRRLDIHELKDEARKLIKELDELKLWNFAIKHVPMKDDEKRQCRAKSLYAG